MRAVVTVSDKGGMTLADIPKPSPSQGQCLVRLKYAALNRRDYWISKGMYPGIKNGVVLGSDGMGIVEEGSEDWVGKEVLINPNINWGDDLEVQSSSYSILGTPENGTLSEYIVVDSDRLVQKPKYLSEEAAASIPLAALTAYRACVTKAQIRASHKVLITGAGGGVSQFAAKIALALGAQVYVTSGDNNKIDTCMAFGVNGGFNYKEEKWWKEALKSTGTFDRIIDSGGGQALNDCIKIVSPGGKIIVYGATGGKVDAFDIHRLFWSQASIVGSTMGNDEEFLEMVNFFSKHQIQPSIDKVFSITEYADAISRFEDASQFGKIVVAIRD